MDHGFKNTWGLYEFLKNRGRCKTIETSYFFERKSELVLQNTAFVQKLTVINIKRLVYFVKVNLLNIIQ